MSTVTTSDTKNSNIHVEITRYLYFFIKKSIAGYLVKYNIDQCRDKVGKADRK